MGMFLPSSLVQVRKYTVTGGDIDWFETQEGRLRGLAAGYSRYHVATGIKPSQSFTSY